MRQALSMAIDREALIGALYHGTPSCRGRSRTPARGATGSRCSRLTGGACRCRRSTSAKAKRLVKEAGAEGKTITIGTTSQISSLATQANSVRQAAVEIGLKAKIDSVSDRRLHQLLHERLGAQGNRRVSRPPTTRITPIPPASTTRSRSPTAARTSTASRTRRSRTRSRPRAPRRTPTSARRSSPRPAT